MPPKVLVANRGEIACRIVRTLDRLGIASVAVHSDADSGAPHVAMASEAVRIGPSPVSESYASPEAVLAAVEATGATAVHPGYGLLSENAAFAEACERLGARFVGPTPDQIRAFGLKHRARELARAAGVAICPGTDLLASREAARAAAEEIGFPVLLKATAGGGGIGMASCRDAVELDEAYGRVTRLAGAHFGAAEVFLERWIEHARHVEVQLFGDGDGRVVSLGERDCSTQRRRQKVIEETPAPGLSDALREHMARSARRLAESISYRSAGTVEFLLDARTGEFYFLEVNTRLQVEHPVTECVWGVDLVEWMVRLALDDLPTIDLPAERPGGHAIEVRLYAEDPQRDFQPSTGVLTRVAYPDDARVDGWIATGTEVTPFYDPLLSKLVVHGADRDAALDALADALDATRLDGLETNLAYLRAIVADAAFRAGGQDTAFLDHFTHTPATVEVLAPGTFSTVQDFPGRLGYWHVGVPPSGPMDDRSFRLGNRIVGNREGTAALELTATGPTLRFHRASTVCLAGAAMRATLDGEPVPRWRAFDIPAGATLELGGIDGPGYRTYLSVRGGFDVAPYLGSCSTFTLGGFGGHAGATLRTGDVLHLGPADDPTVAPDEPLRGEAEAALAPPFATTWRVGVLDGPHASPDFFTDADLDAFYGHDWEVHFHSDRTGTRLIGPKPGWARSDGGEAGLHPSNIHDTPYAVGAVDFTGDMPVVLGPDGPSLGGFVCPVVVARDERWKLGQLRPGDHVRFVPLDGDDAVRRERAVDAQVAARAPLAREPLAAISRRSAILHAIREAEGRPAVTFRRAGDRYLLVEYGPMVLDLDLRVRIEALRRAVEERRATGALPGLIDVTPGIRSLQIHFDSRVVGVDALVGALTGLEQGLAGADEITLPTRIVRLPLSWDDPATREAIDKYVRVVRDDAPWCPSNIEFIRRINGLDTVDEVKRIVFDASYLVLGLGDVYLGAPVATPLDPRHRLVTTKYNPARTWTPENAVGIGGAYLCIYGMEGPGGYQFVGRTVPVWNTYRQTHDFRDGKPWLLRFFDQIRFFPVTPDELLETRRRVREGRVELDVEESTFSLAAYHAFLHSIEPEASAFKARQQAAFEAERARWVEAGELEAAARAAPASAAAPDSADSLDLPDGAVVVEAPLGAQVWKVSVTAGQRVAPGDPLAVLEAMKTETQVPAPCGGVVHAVLCSERQLVSPGSPLVAIIPG